MKGIICFYSNTGNTRALCDLVKSSINDIEIELFDITKGSKVSFDEYSVVGFAAYTDQMCVPNLMIEYIDAIKTCEKKYAFILNTYGSISGRTLLHMKALIKRKGFIVFDGFSLHAPENYPPMIIRGFPFESEPSISEIGKLKSFLDRLKVNIELIANNFPPKIYKLGVNRYNSLIPVLPKFFSKFEMGYKSIDKNKCVKCGLCIRLCPSEAIGMVEIPVFNEKKCQYCWKCYNSCPNGSIQTKKYSGDGRYPKPKKEYLEKLQNIDNIEKCQSW